MTPPPSAFDVLARQRPEWQPWLAVVDEALREAAGSSWQADVPGGDGLDDDAAPRLAGTALCVDGSLLRHLWERLVRSAARAGTPKMAALGRMRASTSDVLALFTGSVCHDIHGLNELAASAGVDGEALQAVAALLAVPFLQACNRAWSQSIPESWVEGYCPVCGSWPAFVEVRGIDRSRHRRCGRCGAEWHAQALSCPYCAITDHHELVTLVPEGGDAHMVIDACRRCLGYVKTFNRLAGCPPGAVMLEDLKSVDFDVAAIEQGYTRPTGAGYPLLVTATDKRAAKRFFAWNA